MAAFPAYGTLYKYSEKPGINPVLRSQFERGPVKQTKILSKQLYEMSIQYVFSNSEYGTWKTWYDTTINRGADYFDFTHPMSGSTISARIKDGQFSAQPFSTSGSHIVVNITVEYYA